MRNKILRDQVESNEQNAKEQSAQHTFIALFSFIIRLSISVVTCRNKGMVDLNVAEALGGGGIGVAWSGFPSPRAFTRPVGGRGLGLGAGARGLRVSHLVLLV